MDLTDLQWMLVQPIIDERHPPSPTGSTVGGRPAHDPRPILDAILWKIRHASPWADLPKCYPSHQTCYRRFRLWGETGTLNMIFHTLSQDLLQCGGFDLNYALKHGDIMVERRDGRSRIFASSQLHDTWQFSTALVFLQIALATTSLSRVPQREILT